jgi:hypothetical protein
MNDATEEGNERVVEVKGVSARTVCVRGFVQGVGCELLVDTGCSTTIVSKRVYDLISDSERPCVEVCWLSIQLADGSRKPVFGKTNLAIQIDGVCVRQDVLIAEIMDSVLLGLDFFRDQHVTLDMGRGLMMLKGREIALVDKMATMSSVSRVRIAQTTMVPAQSRTIIPGITEDSLAVGNWVTEALSDRCPGGQPVLVARGLFSGGTKYVPVEVLNVSDEDVVLRKDTHVAKVELVDAIDTATIPVDPVVLTVDVSHETPQVELPEELQSLVDRVQVEMTDEERKLLVMMLHRNRGVFMTKGTPLGHTHLVEHDIVTTEPGPIRQSLRRIPFGLRDEAQKEVESMLTKGVIEPSNSPWAAPVVLVRKKDQSLRYCVDFRRLNSITKKDSYPLPRIDEALDSLGNSKFFTTLDLASGYWQVGLSDTAREKTAFLTPSGLYQFTVMPFGLCNAPATFERLMERVLVSLQWQICLVYIDDIIVFSKSITEHIDRLEIIFHRLAEANLKLKCSKCHLLRERVTYLGHVVSASGVSTDPEKIKAVLNWPEPTTSADVKSFMGLCSYYKRFIPDFSAIARPLIRLTEKNVQFQWSNDERGAWELLKGKLTTAPILAYPDPKLPFILDTDASEYGIGAVLSQIQGGVERVISYGSRSLSKQERRYCVTRKEMLACVFFVKHFHHYLAGRHFTLRTDHSALKWLKSFHSPEEQVARWIQVIDSYDFTIEHRPGRLHGNADALSRGPCGQCGGPHAGCITRKSYNPSNEKCMSISECDNTHDITQGAVCKVNTRGQQVRCDSPNSWIGDCVLDLRTIVDAQSADPAVCDAIEWLRGDRKPSWHEVALAGIDVKFLWSQFSSLRFENGVLFRELPSLNGFVKRQFILPSALRKEALDACHDNLTAGHFGFRRTLNQVRRRFIWPNMRREIEEYCRSCNTCSLRKTNGPKRKAPMKSYVCGLPFERVALDLMGPFPLSTRGNRYVLVVTDQFTKWMEAYPIPNIEAKTVASVFVQEFISRFGCPRFLHSDQGKQFEAEVFQELCVLLEIKKTRTTPYHPCSDGLSEKNVQTVGKLIRTFCTSQKEWDANINLLTMAYRSTPHPSTGFTPNRMVMGREVDFPLDVVCCMGPVDNGIQHPEYVTKLRQDLVEAYETARENLKEAACVQKKYYDVGVRGMSFKEGDVVYVQDKTRRTGVCPKLECQWKGPYLVNAVINDVTYEVLMGRNKSKVFHFNLLKPCFSKELPVWLKRAQNRLSES